MTVVSCAPAQQWASVSSPSAPLGLLWETGDRRTWVGVVGHTVFVRVDAGPVRCGRLFADERGEEVGARLFAAFCAEVES